MFPTSYFSVDYFPPTYFPAGLAPAPVLPLRDWDVLEDIEARLIGTGQFDLVVLGDPPEERGTGEAYRSACFLIPMGWVEVAFDPEFQLHTATFGMVLIASDDDPRTRDREVDRLLSVVQNSITNQSLAQGRTIDRDSKVSKGTYQKSQPPERRMNVTGQFAYLVEDATGHSTLG